MRKFFKKIICVCAAAVMTAGTFAVSACDGVYKSSALKGDISGTVESNGGFAVKKGNYIYYINGKQTYTADNTFGKVETGAIMRISETDLASRNYAKAETVVPEIAYSGNTTYAKSSSGNINGGLFIYGDYVYYSTPSAEKNSDGEIQNSDIVFKRAKLDGTEVMKNYYAKYSDNTIDYRFVEGEDDVIYLLYVAKSENLYGKSCNNLHSVNTQTNTDTLLAYNVDKVLFDSSNVENDRVFYTMNVTDFKTTTTAFSSYNQVYTVTADVTTPNEYDFTGVDDYNAEEDPLYVNCGTLVYDGIGKIDGNLNLTTFNAKELNDEATLNSLSRAPYKFTLSSYENGTLFYTMSTPEVSNKLFAVKEDELTKPDRKPAMDVPSLDDCLVDDGSNAANYTYLFEDGELTGALISDDKGLVKTRVDENGKLLTINDTNKVDYTKTFSISGDKGKPTVLFFQEHDGKKYVYYSESGSGANGYIIKRVCYEGEYDEYPKNAMQVTDKPEYTPVQILDLDCSNDWYLPEMFDGRIFFSTQTTNMTEYSEETSNYTHIMICDISSVVDDSAKIKELNEQYEEIEEIIDDADETVYENLKQAYRYVYYTGDAEYIDTVIDAYVNAGEDEESYWTKDTVEKVRDFAIANGDWSDFSDKKDTVNGKTVYANQQDYYYSLLGKMTEADASAYDTYLRDTYLRVMPEEELGWYASLSTGAKAGFYIGVIGGSLVVIAAATVVALIIVRKRKSKLPVYTKKRIKVDTTDDKSVDVYSTDEDENAEK